MIKMLKNILYSFYTSRTMRSLFAFAMIILLSGCEDDSEVGLAKDDADCWQTGITHSVLGLVNALYAKGGNLVVVTKAGANLIFVAFAVWMGFKLFKVLTAFKEESLGEVWTEIFQKLFLCAFCAYFISKMEYMDEALNTFVLPIYQAFIELGLNSLSVGKTLLSISLGDFGSIDFTISGEKCTDLFSYFTGEDALTKKIESGDLETPLERVTDCLICEISDRLNTGYRVGIALITSLSFGSMLVGFLVVFLFTAAKFGFVLYLVDSLFRLNFVVFLLPALIMGIPFSYTRKWSKHGFEMFINSSAIMFFMALLVNICATAIEKIFDTIKITSSGIAAKDTSLFTIFLVALLMVNIPGFAVVLANKFVGGGNGQEFNEKISKFLINTLKKTAGAALNSITSGAATIATTTAQKYDESRQALDHLKQAKHSAQSVLNSLAGYNDDDEEDS